VIFKASTLVLTYLRRLVGAALAVMRLLIILVPSTETELVFSAPGNLVEWRYPPDVNLEGVEFKSIASGLHNVPKDFM